MYFCHGPVCAIVLAIGHLGYGLAAAIESGAPAPIPLPPSAEWKAEDITLGSESGLTTITVPKNYVIGRAISPVAPVKPGELYTFTIEASTEVPAFARSYYRFWIALEFTRDGKVVHTASSPEIVGEEPEAALIGVTGVAPPGAGGVRAVLLTQNKHWSQVKNRARVKNPQLLKLAGVEGASLTGNVASPLGPSKGKRSATVAFSGGWPDGTALSISADKGQAARMVLMASGKADIRLDYTDHDVGRTNISASVCGHSSDIEVRDPLAGTVTVSNINADGAPTPAVARFTLDGKMVPGPYQSSVPGIFITSPYEIDLQPGTWSLEISRGPQFETYKREIRVESGRKETLEAVELKRRVDPRTSGWYGGDSDGDVYHGERIYTDVGARTAATISQALGLDWLGAGNWGAPDPKTWGEVREHAKTLGGSRLLFMWTDENPKTRQGHGCFVGLEGPDHGKLKWAWSGPKRPLENFEVLAAIRANGGATFVNHPLRWWMKGERFNTNMYSSLPFDLCAAGALDGFNINDGEKELAVWSMLLDHGFKVAATAGADFCLDRPAGPLPGTARMYAYCPDGLTPKSLARAVREGHTVVSTGPVLLADVKGLPPGSTLPKQGAHRIHVRSWARGDHADPIQKMELWSHGKVIASHPSTDPVSSDHTFTWTPAGDSDWVAVRVLSKRGWAMTSAFYADGPRWRAKQPVDCDLEIQIHGLTAAEMQKAEVQIWDRDPALPNAIRTQTAPATGTMTMKIPVTASVVVTAPGRKRIESRVFDATGAREVIDRIAGGKDREQPLTVWSSYQEVLDGCKTGKLRFDF